MGEEEGRDGLTFSDSEDVDVFEFDDDRKGGKDSLCQGRAAVEVGADLGILDSGLVREIRFRCLEWEAKCKWRGKGRLERQLTPSDFGTRTTETVLFVAISFDISTYRRSFPTTKRVLTATTSIRQ